MARQGLLVNPSPQAAVIWQIYSQWVRRRFGRCAKRVATRNGGTGARKPSVVPASPAKLVA